MATSLNALSVITYPKLETRDGRAYYLRVSIAALRRLAKANVTLHEQPQKMGDMCDAVASIVSACAYDDEAGLKYAGLSVDDAAEMFDLTDIPRIYSIVNETVEKAMAAVTTPVRPPV